MKKKFIYVGVLCLWATKSLAQLNVQLHYDLGHGMYGNEISSRQHLTATVENFSADKWGRKGRWLCFRGCLSDWRGLQLE